MTGTFKGGHKIAVDQYLSRLKEEKLRREERRWFPIDSATNIPAEENTEEDVITRIEADAVKRSLTQLPKRWRTVVELHIEEGQTLKEVGEELGVSRSRAGNIQQAALRRLRQLFPRGSESEGGVER
ncbi:hypothetical protein A3D00_02885 [Candidatus Woesebacteria bacterium RIFCSPHIGHO2_02_FULL_38_9]|uniref:RNA polymerase sigma-70 domain-containing protein n=1 Tax=Candidatus Woesebacteria bacterium RIFCSPHIGHO2_01_FULL_39_28 TaxID=1802496 RepID=A0A1F7YI16_9BACT|nr:MAG: hypothetical protein A2627_03840 [Candidatus Woesebacteria bacterium RIFCSPHIGHO2_01_FULL_39_28]OGM35330.1 MAG: hypothetical protein A3D00_02885 [Candidatus Woesebacteria bacterium RIFCSPHIGHO2_02_FULL_38_9]OGM58555.1 MAG: hypothetical protein A3A50_00850 [Candidatus Woesebacteria bacterium RIFCSPLOWO2_01_FULL_38_20]